VPEKNGLRISPFWIPSCPAATDFIWPERMTMCRWFIPISAAESRIEKNYHKREFILANIGDPW
jgi:hypothetical protein